MTIKIKYFGMLSECCGKNEENWDISENTSLSGLKNELLQAYPTLAEKQYKLAVNQKISDGDEILSEGDEIALLPPFAGG
jgi:sulfur-carrier protein